jgi:hypothetical protein
MKKSLSIATSVATSLVAVALSQGVAHAGGAIGGPCGPGYNTCQTQLSTLGAGPIDVSLDAELWDTPGKTMTAEIEVGGPNGEPIIACRITGVPESAPAGSWVCKGVVSPNGSIRARSYTEDGQPGSLAVGARW